MGRWPRDVIFEPDTTDSGQISSDFRQVESSTWILETVEFDTDSGVAIAVEHNTRLVRGQSPNRRIRQPAAWQESCPVLTRQEPTHQ